MVEAVGGWQLSVGGRSPDHVFILADNRAHSHDWHAIGPVPLAAIKGRVWLIYWPLDEMAWVLQSAL